MFFLDVYIHISFINLGKFSAVISSVNLSALFCLSSVWHFQKNAYVHPLSGVPQQPQTLFTLFIFFFLFLTIDNFKFTDSFFCLIKSVLESSSKFLFHCLFQHQNFFLFLFFASLYWYFILFIHFLDFHIFSFKSLSIFQTVVLKYLSSKSIWSLTCTFSVNLYFFLLMGHIFLWVFFFFFAYLVIFCWKLDM